MVENDRNFWDVVHAPFVERELNRAEVRALISRGLAEAEGQYKALLPLFGLSDSHYLKFMDFLRHH